MRGAILSNKGILFSSLPAIALTLVLIGISIGVGVWINEETGTTITDTTAFTNESVTFTTNTTYTSLANVWIKSITAVYNNSANTVVIGSGNYTLTDFTGGSQLRCCLMNNILPDNVPKYVTYKAYNSDIFVTKNATSGMAKLAEWLPIIGVVIAAGVIITILVTAFVFGKQEEV